MFPGAIVVLSVDTVMLGQSRFKPVSTFSLISRWVWWFTLKDRKTSQPQFKHSFIKSQ